MQRINLNDYTKVDFDDSDEADLCLTLNGTSTNVYFKKNRDVANSIDDNWKFDVIIGDLNSVELINWYFVNLNSIDPMSLPLSKTVKVAIKKGLDLTKTIEKARTHLLDNPDLRVTDIWKFLCNRFTNAAYWWLSK